MQARRPAQHGFRQRIFQPPVGFDLFEQAHRRGLDPLRLALIDVIALSHGAHAALARIFIGEAAHEVVQQPFAHGTLGDAHPVDAETLDHLEQNGEAGRKHRCALRIHFRQIQFIDMAGGNHPLRQAVEILERDVR